MKRYLVIALTCLICVASFPAASLTADAGGTLLVTGVTVVPAPPEAGEAFTVRATIRNPVDSGTTYDLGNVILAGDAPEPDRRASASPRGVLLPGHSRTVELRTTIEEKGTRRLRVHVSARGESGSRVSVQYPFPVAVGGDHPSIAIRATDLIATAETTIPVTVSNGMAAPLRNLELGFSAPGLEIEKAVAVRPRLGGGTATTFRFPVTAATAGRTRLTATLSYTGANDTRRIVRRETTAVFDPPSTLPEPEVAVDASNAYAGSETPVRVTVVNGRDAPIRNLAVRLRGSGLAVRAQERVRARIDSGSSTTVSFPVVADSSGRKSLAVELSYTGSGGVNRTVRQNTTLQVRSAAAIPAPSLSLDVEEAVAGTRTNASVTVANGLDTDLRDLALRLSGAAVEADARWLRSRISAGESVTVDLPIVATRAGRQNVTATLVATVHGVERTVVRRTTIDVAPLRDRVQVSARPIKDGSALAVELVNLGPVPVENVLVRGQSPNATVSRSTLDRVQSGTTRIALVNVSRRRGQGPIDVSVTAAYDLGDRRERANASVTVTPHLGSIALTGITVERARDRSDAARAVLHVSGSASNVGATGARSVLVSVVDTANVTPTSPNRDYFVGAVPASDFASFDVYVSVEGHVSAIPLRVTYLVDGQRRERVHRLPYDAPDHGGGDTRSGRSLPSVLVGTIGVLVALAVAGIVVTGWRNRGE